MPGFRPGILPAVLITVGYNTDIPNPANDIPIYVIILANSLGDIHGAINIIIIPTHAHIPANRISFLLPQ